MDINTLPYLKGITNEDLLYSTWNFAQCYLAAWTRVGFGGECIHVYVRLSPFPVHLKLSQHCLLIGYILIQNRKFLFNISKFWGENFTYKNETNVELYL